MPVGCPIQAIPNQEFSITLNGNVYDIGIGATAGVMSVSISLNGTLLVESLHAAACAPLIPAEYLEDGDGNFMFLTANNQLPNYTQFNVTQSLLYFSAAELAAYRMRPVAASPLVPTVTAAFFNPVGQLPMRFAPRLYGYNQADLTTDQGIDITTSGGDQVVVQLGPS